MRDAARSPALAIVFAAVFAGVYLPVVQLEEQHLRDLFADYAAYAERVPALLPRFRRNRKLRKFALELGRWRIAKSFLCG